METQGNDHAHDLLKAQFISLPRVLPSTKMSSYWYRPWESFSPSPFIFMKQLMGTRQGAGTQVSLGTWKTPSHTNTTWSAPYTGWRFIVLTCSDGSVPHVWEKSRILSLYPLCHPYGVALIQKVRDGLPPHPHPTQLEGGKWKWTACLFHLRIIPRGCTYYFCLCPWEMQSSHWAVMCPAKHLVESLGEKGRMGILTRSTLSEVQHEQLLVLF